MAIKTIKHVELTFASGAATPLHAECQSSSALLEDTSSPSELTSFCGTESVPAPAAYELSWTAWQDYGLDGSIFDLLHAAYVAYRDDPEAGEIDVVLTVGTVTRSFTARMTADLPFGGDAGGDGLVADVTLSVSSEVTDGVAA